MKMISSLKFIGFRGHSRTSRLLKSFTTQATYYDSQSGLQVPIHDEQEISIFYNARKDGKIPDSLLALKNQKSVVHGLILPEDEGHNLESLLENSPTGFQFFSSVVPTRGKSDNVSLLVDYDPNKPEKWKEILQSRFQDGWKTMILLGDGCFDGRHEPIMVANDVAALLDATKAGNFLWISNSGPLRNPEGVVQLCEELQYLDIPGATIKSRLTLDVMDEDIVEEAMMQGVNKYVVTEKEQIKTVQNVAEEQGKSLVFIK